MSCNKFKYICSYRGEDFTLDIKTDDLTNATGFRGGFRLEETPIGTPFTVTQIDSNTVRIELSAATSTNTHQGKYKYTIRCTTAENKEYVILNGDFELFNTYY